MHLQLAVVALQACVGLYPSVKVVSVAKKLSGPIMMQEASMVEHEVEQYISVLHIFFLEQISVSHVEENSDVNHKEHMVSVSCSSYSCFTNVMSSTLQGLSLRLRG